VSAGAPLRSAGGCLRELGPLLRVAAPLIVSQLSQVAMGFTDTVMAGRLGATELAAIGIGASLWLPVYIGCLGLLMPVSPFTARLWGARRLQGIGALFRQGLWLAAGLALFAVPLTRLAGGVPGWLGLDPALGPPVAEYLDAVAWGMPGACLYLAGRFVVEGRGDTRPIMLVQLFGLALNVVLDWCLMFGRLGAPALGVAGAGWATATVFWIDAALILWYLARAPELGPARLYATLEPPVAAELGRILRLGVPIAVAALLELGLFLAVALLMGRIGRLAAAAHQVALNYAALMFMIPLGLSLAITVRVGQAMGRGDAEGARRIAVAGMGLSVILASLSAAVMLLVPGPIVRLYTGDEAVANLAVKLLGVAAAFQLADGLQVCAVGALRGLHDTAWPMALTFTAYWLLGFPLAVMLGFAGGLGPVGLWWGLVAGLSLAAVLLIGRFRILVRRELARAA